MADLIKCPQCQTEIEITEALAAPLLEKARQENAQMLAQKDAQIAEREKQTRQREEAVGRAAETVNQRVADQLRTERAKIAGEELKKAQAATADEFAKLKQERMLAEEMARVREAKLAEAQRAQADFLVKSRELDDARREMVLTIQKQVQENLAKVREVATKESEDRFALKLAESQQTNAALQQKLQEALRKAEQGSQQLQGEVLEIKLETLLKEKFPLDVILPVAKGEFGGDVVQHVSNGRGKICGSILWESKRTKNWTDTWLPKLRDDQRAAKADVAIIISQTLPKGIDTFDHIDGIWISDIRCAIPVALALRHGLIELASARSAADGQQTKMEMVYQYLTGPRFKQRIGAIVEKFSDMHADLEKERKAMTRLWAKREEQIRSVLDATAGLYGDLQGIAGKSLEEIDGLTLPVPPPLLDSSQ